jgi:hypothetical protein
MIRSHWRTARGLAVSPRRPVEMQPRPVDWTQSHRSPAHLYRSQAASMNWLWSRLLKTAYRRDPIASFVLTMGAVQLAIAGSDGEAGLAALGLIFAGSAAALYWWKYASRVIQAARSPAPFRYSAPPMGSPRDRRPPLRVDRAGQADDLDGWRSRRPLPPLRLPDRPANS